MVRHYRCCLYPSFLIFLLPQAPTFLLLFSNISFCTTEKCYGTEATVPHESQSTKFKSKRDKIQVKTEIARLNIIEKASCIKFCLFTVGDRNLMNSLACC